MTSAYNSSFASSRSIRTVDPQTEDALCLLREAALEARALYPEFHVEGAPWPTNEPTAPGGIYVVAHEGGAPVACGALRPMGGETVEVRRMYVLKSARRSGIASEILCFLEREAARLGHKLMLLETGNRQGPAAALYSSHGFKRIPPFGPHADDPTSVCYEKHVASDAGAPRFARSRSRVDPRSPR